MSVVKVIEILAQSDKSWEDAAQSAVTAASKSVRNIKSIYIENMQAIVKDNKIVEYRVDTKISFVVE
jgi:flavin-binding protein dodecin